MLVEGGPTVIAFSHTLTVSPHHAQIAIVLSLSPKSLRRSTRPCAGVNLPCWRSIFYSKFTYALCSYPAWKNMLTYSSLRNIYNFMHPNEDQRANQVRKLVETLLSHVSTYHHHKEMMAHAGIALQITLFVWIMSRDQWPPAWVGEDPLAKFFTALFLFIILVGLHIFIRWQLRLRRHAAMQLDGFQNTIGRWTLNDPTSDEMKPYQNSSQKQTWRECWLDFLIPRFKLTLPLDDGKQGYPQGLVNDLLNQDVHKRGERLLLPECIFTTVSFLILIILLFRTFLGNPELISIREVWSADGQSGTSLLIIIIQALIALGTLLVAVLAIWGPWVRSILTPPKLSIQQHDLRGTLTQFTDGRHVFYYYLKLVNSSPWRWRLSKNCRVLLKSVLRQNSDQRFLPVPLPVSPQFVWAPAETTPAAINITKEQVIDFGRLIENGPHFEPVLYMYPNNFQGYVGPNEVVRYCLEIAADGYMSKKLYIFEVSWNGRWSDDLDEMRKHLIIHEIKEKDTVLVT